MRIQGHVMSNVACASCIAREGCACTARIERLEAALRNAREVLEDWGLYISDDMRQRHGFAGDLAEIDAALSGTDNTSRGIDMSARPPRHARLIGGGAT